MLKLFLLYTSLILTSTLYAQVCPPSGKKVSNELWPLKFASISNQAFVNKPSAQNVPALFAAKVMASWQGKQAPELLVFEKDLASTINKDKFWQDFHAELERKKVSKAEQEKLKTNIKFVSSFGATWQRDHSVYTVDYPSKTVQMHNFLEKKNDGQTIVENSEIFKKREIIDFTVDNTKNENGNAGGNVLGIPGGLCLTGNNIDLRAAESFCPEKDRIQIETHWLWTGHVDEFIKFVPDLADENSPPECRFKILANSPQKALELLASRPNEAFRTTLLSGEELKDEKNVIFREACMIMHASGFHFKKPAPSKKGSKAKSAWYEQLSLISPTWAQAVDDGSWIMERDLETSQIMERCLSREDEINNRNIHQSILKNKNIFRANEAIEESIKNSLGIIKSSLRKRLPQCDLSNKVIPVPQIYTGAEIHKEKGRTVLSDPGTSQTVFPNITNSVTSNGTLIISDQRNQAFKDYTDVTMKSLGLRADYIDTLFFSDLGNGNIHCATASVHVCE